MPLFLRAGWSPSLECHGLLCIHVRTYVVTCYIHTYVCSNTCISCFHCPIHGISYGRRYNMYICSTYHVMLSESLVASLSTHPFMPAGCRRSPLSRCRPQRQVFWRICSFVHCSLLGLCRHCPAAATQWVSGRAAMAIDVRIHCHWSWV